MIIKLHRYYGDEAVTKSVMEVWMDGEQAPRMVYEAREVRLRDYAEEFTGASGCCLPYGKWPLKVGSNGYSIMGLRVARCPGHRNVGFGWNAFRQCQPGAVMMGECTNPEAPAEERRIGCGERVLRRLEELTYKAFGRGENFYVEIDNESISEANDI